MIEREPVTIVVSEKGWIRALKGNVEDLSALQFKATTHWLFRFSRKPFQKFLCSRAMEGFSRLKQASCRRARPGRTHPSDGRYREARRSQLCFPMPLPKKC